MGLLNKRGIKKILPKLAEILIALARAGKPPSGGNSAQ